MKMIKAVPITNEAVAPFDQFYQMAVPKHTRVKMNVAIWYLAPLPVSKEQLAAVIILPECTSMPMTAQLLT